MRNKTDFYRLFFEQLARRGFDVKRSQSSDYIADIYFKNQLVAYFSKVDTVIQNPFVTVKDKLIRLINDTAQDTANKAGAATVLILTPMRNFPMALISWQNTMA